MFSFERMLKIWEKYGHMYWNGLGYTLLFAFVSVLMGLVLGLVLASGRMASVQSRDNLAVKALKAVAKFFCTAYVEVFRATPMLVQVFIIYYGLGNVFKLPDSSLNRMFWGMVAVGLNSAAYMSEVIRSGIGAVPGGQMEAARSLGFGSVSSMLRIVMPQAVKNILPNFGNEFANLVKAVRNILPAMCNEFVTIIKETSILGMVGIVELMFRAQSIAKQTYIFLEPYVIAAIMYFIIVFPLSKIIAAVERRMSVTR